MDHSATRPTQEPGGRMHPFDAVERIGVHLEGDDIVTRGFTGEVFRWRLPQSGSVIDACARHPPCAIVP